MTPEENRRMRDAYGAYAPGFESTRPMQVPGVGGRTRRRRGRWSPWGARILAIILAIGAVGAFSLLIGALLAEWRRWS